MGDLFWTSENAMPLPTWMKAWVGFDHMAHRPPLRMRFWIYSAAAYLIPVVVQVALPADPGLSDELVWLVTLAPAFLLSLHYGLRGAFAGLIMGTALFMVVQVVVALNFTPDDWRITVVDRNDDHHYRPGYLFVPFGDLRPDQIVRSRRRQLPCGLGHH